MPQPRYELTGTVLDDRGRPIEGASVLRSGRGGFNVRTDVTGSFSTLVTEGRYDLTISAPGFNPRYETFTVSAPVVLNVTLTPGVVISGSVTEAGVAGPLNGVTVEIASGPNAGKSMVTGPGVGGSYRLPELLPGTITVRARKEGYDIVEQTVTATVDTRLDFTLKWAYGACLQSVAPVVFSSYPTTGGTERVSVLANANRTWTATPDVPWIVVESPGTHIGFGEITFRILPNPVGGVESRRGALMIRCSASEGQNVWVTQIANCQIRLEPTSDTPAVFPASGGPGSLNLQVTPPRCFWVFRSAVAWIQGVGISSWPGQPSVPVSFVVAPNTTGIERSGVVFVGETPWVVTQSR